MKKLAVSLLIGVIIGIVTLCITTEIMGFVYVNNNMSEYIVSELFTQGGIKVLLSTFAGILVGILIYIEDSDASAWKKVISFIFIAFIGIIYLFVMSKMEMPTERFINTFVYEILIMTIATLYNTINKEILKKDIKKINEKLEK